MCILYIKLMIFCPTKEPNDNVTFFPQGMVTKAMKQSVKDPVLAQKLVPNYPLGCKRITPSDTYLKVRGQFLISPLGVKLAPRGALCPRGVKLSPRGKYALFGLSFF
jgi:hypothetical protein